MPQKIGLIADIHATPAPVSEALAIFCKQGVDRIFCVGDIAGYGEELDQSILLLKQSDCQLILGNHELWFMEGHPENSASYAFRFFSRLPKFLSLTMEGKNLSYLRHSEPAGYDLPDSCAVRQSALNCLELGNVHVRWMKRST